MRRKALQSMVLEKKPDFLLQMGTDVRNFSSRRSTINRSFDGPAQVGYTCEGRWREPSLVVTLKGPQHA